ncbi:PASTA domain-containing protein [Frondihabitans sucicola]
MGSEAAIKELSSTDTNRPARTQTRPPVAWIWAGIVMIAIVIAAVVFWVGHLSPVILPSATGVSVPSLTSETYSAGAAKLTKLKLVPERVDITSNSIADGKIIKTSPPSGTKVAEQETVSVYVSTGPETVTLPDVSGQTADDAWNQLSNLGLEKGSVTQQDSPDKTAGTVISTSPAIGKSVTLGSTVNIVVSSGTVAVPDVTTKPVADAMTSLQALGLTVQTVGDDTCTGNIVKSQDLPVGEQEQGSTITLTVCTGQ